MDGPGTGPLPSGRRVPGYLAPCVFPSSGGAPRPGMLAQGRLPALVAPPAPFPALAEPVALVALLPVAQALRQAIEEVLALIAEMAAELAPELDALLDVLADPLAQPLAVEALVTLPRRSGNALLR